MTDSKHNVLDPNWEETLRRGQEEEGEAGSVEAELAFVHLLRHAREPEAIAPEQLDAIWSAIENEVAPAKEPWWRKAWVWWSAPALAAAAVLVVVIANPSDDETQVARQDKQAESKAEELSSRAGDRAEGESAAPAPARNFDGAAEGTPSPLAEAVPAEAEEAAEKKMTMGDGGFPAGAAADSAKADKQGGSGMSAFEMNFVKLAPHGRLAVRVSVDQSRDELRSQLLAKARGGGQ
jgi:hypothetical protein